MKKLFVIIVLAAATSAFAQQYRWTDANGKVQYGDVPPPGVKATRLKPPASGPSSSASSAAVTKDAGGKALTPEQAFRKRQEDAAKDRETQARAEQAATQKREACERAQAALRTLESGQRVSRTDTKGERYFLDEAQIEQETAKARQAVQQSCG